MPGIPSLPPGDATAGSSPTAAQHTTETTGRVNAAKTSDSQGSEVIPTSLYETMKPHSGTQPVKNNLKPHTGYNITDTLIQRRGDLSWG